MEVVRTIVQDVRYEGWVSFEFFSRTLEERHGHVPEEHAQRAEAAWIKLSQEMGWDEGGEHDGVSASDCASGSSQQLARL